METTGLHGSPLRDLTKGLAPAVGLEPTTKRLTAARSTTELRRNEASRSDDSDAAAKGRASGRRPREDSTSRPRPTAGQPPGAVSQGAIRGTSEPLLSMLLAGRMTLTGG